MIDKFFYNFFCALDNMISFVETKSIAISTWCWQKRIRLLNRKRMKNRVKKNGRVNR